MFPAVSLDLLICFTVCVILAVLLIHPDVIHPNVIHTKQTLKYKMLLLSVFALIMCVTVLTNSIVLFFIGIELLGIISAIFVSLEKQSRPASNVYAYNMFASLLFLYGVLNKNTEFGVLCLLVSSFCKSAQFPFSGWLLHATHAHTFVSIFIHCATIIGIAPIFLYKFNYLFVQYSELLSFTTVSGLISAVLLSAMALFETDIKRIMAMLTISSAGAMVVACGLKQANLGMLYFICHAFFKSIIFLLFYYYINYYKSRDIKKFICNHGAKTLGFLALLSSVGFPPFVGSYAKLAIGGISIPIYCKIGVALATLLSDAVFVRLYLTCFGNKNIGQKFKLYPVWILFIISLPIGYVTFINLHGTITLRATIEELFLIITSYFIAKKLPVKQIIIKKPQMSFMWIINFVDYINKKIERIYIATLYKSPYKIGNALVMLRKNSFRMHTILIFFGFIFSVMYVLIRCHD